MPNEFQLPNYQHSVLIESWLFVMDYLIESWLFDMDYLIESWLFDMDYFQLFLVSQKPLVLMNIARIFCFIYTFSCHVSMAILLFVMCCYLEDFLCIPQKASTEQRGESSSPLQCVAVFAKLNEELQKQPDLVRKVSAIIQWNITMEDNVVSTWSEQIFFTWNSAMTSTHY